MGNSSGRALGVGVAVTCALLLAACGTSSAKPTAIHIGTSKGKAPTTASIPTSWVSESSTSGEDSLIQWASDGGSRFTGTFTLAYISTSGRHIDTNNSSVSGLISKGTIEITINGNQFSGTVSPTALSIGIPSSNGTITNFTFTPGTEGEYNGFLSQLRSTVANNVNAYDQQQATAAQQQSVQSDAGTVTSDINNVQGAIGQLQSDVQGTSSDLAGEKTDLGTTQSDYATTQQAVGQYGTGSGNGVCGDADTVAGDADTVAGDLDTIAGDVSSVQQDINQLQSTVTQLQSDATQLANAESAIPGYLPSGTPSTTNVNASVSQSQSAINQALSSMNGYISTANSYQQQAFAFADKAASIGNCGGGPTAPSGLPAMNG
ncbi:hypothetical protein [Ferrimicrobium sp.]|uniref:hypothetical protein n=1 Tax=Ferrimicrobium sp. TaxID=2926050 RepID=UPI002608197B|nr:hypothetical protein [Ferrimicrobium sp.]